MKLQKAIHDAYQNLNSSNINSALLDSELLMANVLNESREHIVLNLNKDIAKKFNLISKDKDFKKFDIYIVLTNHSLIKKKLKKLNNNKFIFNIFVK